MDIEHLERLVGVLRLAGVQYYQSGDTTIVLSPESGAASFDPASLPDAVLGPAKQVTEVPSLYDHPSLGLGDLMTSREKPK